jgi:hypothetical protein
MKGISKVELNGEEIKLKFTLGISEDLQEYADKHNIEDPDNDPKAQRVMFALMEMYANDEWDCDDIVDKAVKKSRKFKALGVDQIKNILALVDEATEGLGKGKAGKK